MIPRTSIEEANKHLNMLHKRVAELEKTIEEQQDMLISKDKLLQTKVSEISSAKDKEIDGLRLKLLESEQTVSALQKHIGQKDKEISLMQRNFNRLKAILAHKASVRHLLKLMDEAEIGVVETADEICRLDTPTKHGTFSNNLMNGVEKYPQQFYQMEQKVEHGKTVHKEHGDKSQNGPGKEFYL